MGRGKTIYLGDILTKKLKFLITEIRARIPLRVHTLWLLLLPCAASADGGSTAGVAVGVMGFVLLVIAVIAGIAIWGICKTFKSPAVRILLATAIIGLFPAYSALKHHGDEEKSKSSLAEHDRIAALSGKYLKGSCAAQERLVVIKKIPLNSSFLLVQSHDTLRPNPLSRTSPKYVLWHMKANTVEEPRSNGALPDSEYILTLEDISTMEDRSHWIARVRATVTRRVSEEVVGSYEGLETLIGPKIVCPQMEASGRNGSGDWDPVVVLGEHLIEQ